MGNSPSTPEVPGGGSEGYHVLKVAPNSPGEKAGLEQFFDFVIAINNIRLDEDSDILLKVCKQNVDKPVTILVYSTKDQNVRKLQLTPTAAWGGDGLLGISIRFSTFDGASENIWHILDVVSASPAANAGLISNTDYIIAADCALEDRDDLFAMIENCNQKELKLYVYNSVTDQCRPVTVIPNDQWGGEGSLGCGIGYGYLHRIPPPEERAKLQGKAQQFAVQNPQQVVVPPQTTTAVAPPPLAVVPPVATTTEPKANPTGIMYTTTGPPNYTMTSQALPPQSPPPTTDTTSTVPPTTTTTTPTTVTPSATQPVAPPPAISPATPVSAPAPNPVMGMTPEQMQAKMQEMQQQMAMMTQMQQQQHIQQPQSSVDSTPVTVPVGLTPAAAPNVGVAQ